MASNPPAVTLAAAIRCERQLLDTDHWRDRIQPNPLLLELHDLELRALTASESELPTVADEFAALRARTKLRFDPELRPWWRLWR